MVSIFTWPVGPATDGKSSATRRVPPFAPVATYCLAATVGGLTTGAALALLGVPARQGGVVFAAFVTVLAVVAALACWCEWNGRLAPLVERRAQVPRSWMGWHRPVATASAFGFLIGAGVFTYLKHAMAYVLAAVVVLAPTIEAGMAVGAVYGFGRGMSLGLTWVGDRYFGRRLRRFRPTNEVTLLNRLAAVVAIVSFAAILGLSIGG